MKIGSDDLQRTDLAAAFESIRTLARLLNICIVIVLISLSTDFFEPASFADALSFLLLVILVLSRVYCARILRANH